MRNSNRRHRKHGGHGEYKRRYTPHGRGLGRMLKDAQRNELTESEIYSKLSKLLKEEEKRDVLKKISEREKERGNFWKHHSGEEVKPNHLKVISNSILSKILGVDFGLKLTERSDNVSKEKYREISDKLPEAIKISEEETEDENLVSKLIDETRLKYVSSMVLGVNDALVELTGALAGLTFALQDTNLIALSGLITGIAASLSMGGSEYLSTKTGESRKSPIKAALYTGTTYLITVILLILPYFLLNQVFLSLILTLVVALIIILCFTFYISVAQNISFRKRFLEMASISLGVSALSFGIGIIVRKYIGVEV